MYRLLLCDLSLYLYLRSDESRMHSLSIAAASINLAKLAGDAHHSSGWEIGLRVGRDLIVKDECIVKRSAKIVT